jgi:amino-acid N-acetyltransferase
LRTSKCVLKIRRAEIEDHQQQIKELLPTFELPLAGLENTKMWILEDKENMIGTAGLEMWGKQGLLRSIAVSKNMHNRGCGTSLVNHIIKEAKKGGVEELFLLTTNASAFFQKSGFKEIDRKYARGSNITRSAEFQGACPKTDILMRLTLN